MHNFVYKQLSVMVPKPNSQQVASTGSHVFQKEALSQKRPRTAHHTMFISALALESTPRPWQPAGPPCSLRLGQPWLLV